MKSSRFFLFVLTAIVGITAVIVSCEKDEDSKPPVGISNRIDIKADSIKNIFYRDAKAYGSVGDYKNITFSHYGHCWDTLETPTIDNSKTEFQNLTAKSVFTSNLTSLKPNKTYYIRSYAKTNSITIYSEIVNFQTRALEAPVVTTDSTTQVASTSVNIWGAIALDGGTDISAKGVCWGITENPTLQNQHAEFTGTQDAFKVPVAGLEKYTTYYARIYAVNQTGTGYGNNITFKTLAEQPQLTTAEVTSITAYTATGGGSITSNGGAEITTRGICWGLDPNPTTSNNQCVASVGTDNYPCNLTILQPGKTYHVRAFATNIAGTSYGNDVTFTTPPVLPTVTTTQITDVTANSATTGGNVTYDGGATVTARGVCWSTSENPTITDSHTTNGSGIGTYSSSITDITFATKYYVRAYATNSAGTTYGSQQTFTTLDGTIALTTTEVTSITATTAVSGGNITSDGGAPVTARGVVWSTSQNPTTATNQGITANGTGTDSFTSNITNLQSGTIYYVRAYATNSVGTTYGNQQTFTTLDGTIALTTAEVTSITATTAVSGGNITSDGGAPITARGVVWSTSQNPTTVTNLGITSNGTGAGTFTSNLTNLQPQTIYYLRAYGTNNYGTQYGNQVSFTIPMPDGPGGTITDADGNIYNTIWINDRQWMKENLRTTKYNDGSSIPNVTDNETWTGLSTPAYCWYSNNITNKSIYGALYNFYTVNTGKLCPTGWHIPTDAEWYSMENYVDPAINNPIATGWRGVDGGTKLKATSRWTSGGNGTDVYGFTAFPGGERIENYGYFYSLSSGGSWWCATESDASSAWSRYISYGDVTVGRGYQSKNKGFSVRCLKN